MYEIKNIKNVSDRVINQNFRTVTTYGVGRQGLDEGGIIQVGKSY